MAAAYMSMNELHKNLLHMQAENNTKGLNKVLFGSPT